MNRAPPPLPLTGRAELLSSLGTILDETEEGLSPTVLLTGHQGVGKSRLAQALCEKAEARSFHLARGRASPMEVNLPYGLWTTALMPLVRRLDSDALATLTRGGASELATIFPHLATNGDTLPVDGSMPGEVKARVYWRFADLLRGLSAQKPMLIVLDDLHWADPSSLDLLHFVTRHVEDCPVGFLGVVTPELRERNPAFVKAEPALLENARTLTVEALNEEQTGQLIHDTFRVEADISRSFVADLFERTRGNPFFIEEVLKALVAEGKLYQQGDTWLGWESKATDVPASVRDALQARLGQLSDDARETIGVAAAAGRRATFNLLEHVSAISEEALIQALDELRTFGLLDETTDDGAVRYFFHHPLIEDVVYSGLGLARTGMLHRKIATALEDALGASSTENIEEIAHHYSLARSKGVDPRAVECLCAAGRRALERHASEEAIQYLSAAAAQIKGSAPEQRAEWTWLGRLEEDLAHAYQRVGDYDTAKGLWLGRLASISGDGHGELTARIRRRLGQAAYWQGLHEESLLHCQAGLEEMDGVPREEEARLRLVRGITLEALGREAEAREDLMAALSIATEVGDNVLLARAHRGLAIIYTWSGHPDKVREHAAATIELGEAAGNRHLVYWGHWALAVMEGFMGDTESLKPHIEECRRLAAELHSPILDVWTSEVSVELASATGDWSRGIALGEQAVARARALGQRTLVPRLLVWLGLIYLGRGDLEPGSECVEEAWTLSGAGTDGATEIHTVLPAHIGMCAWHTARGEWREAIELGERGLRLAEDTGYIIWALYRLLPVIAESYFRLNDVQGARAIGDRMHEFAKRTGHKLGRAWADGFDALEAWHGGDLERGVQLLRSAAEALEAVPMIPDAARIRRQLAGRLADIGDREGALTELRHVHDIFRRMGAKEELRKTRIQFKELDARPPVRVSDRGEHGLTSRELEIAMLVAERLSNKAIAKALNISPHTARTHLANIYQKLGLKGRGELADFVREKGVTRSTRAVGG
ncbi:MAG: AAA family ATPase [Gemmatimonadetes bacterium]|nr:AAA family ATPase [Gemmatimonadota bacterium]